MRGAAAALLDSYDVERVQAADDNIMHSTRATDFIAPPDAYERRLRNVTLRLARTQEFARRMVNAGRLSRPTPYASPLSTPDGAPWAGGPAPGAPMIDAPHGPGFLGEAVDGEGFALLHWGDPPPLPAGVAAIAMGAPDDIAGRRYDADPGTAYLLRPDLYVAARFRRPDAAALAAALARARGERP